MVILAGKIYAAANDPFVTQQIALRSSRVHGKPAIY